MAIDLAMLKQPKVLIIGGVAVVVGLFVASKAFKGGSNAAPEAQAPISQTIVRDPANDPGSQPVAGHSSPAPVSAPATSPHVAPVHTLPVIPVPHTTAPVAVAPVLQPSIPGTPRRDLTPPPPNPAPQPTSLPGGFPADCRGVQHRNQNHPNATDPASIEAWVNARIRAGNSKHISWQQAQGVAIMGTTNQSMPRVILDVYLIRGAGWLNGVRRDNGLRALNQQAFDQLKADYVAYCAPNSPSRSRGGTDIAPQFVYDLFAKYHTPYLCP